MKIVIDKDICFKTGQCFFLHKDLMQEGIDNYPESLIEGDVPEDKLEDATKMAQACPSGAISLRD
jgi:ferredoxin